MEKCDRRPYGASETQSCDRTGVRLDAAKVFRKLQYLGGIDEVDLLDTAAIVKSEPKVHDNSIYEAVHAEEPYVDQCLRRYLGRIAKCETEEELRASGNGVTATAIPIIITFSVI